MLKRLLLLCIFFVVTVVGMGYYYYVRWQRLTHPVTIPAPSIPSNAALVFSFNSLEAGLRKLKKDKFGQVLGSTPFLQEMEAFSNFLLGIDPTKSLLKEVPLLFSWHWVNEVGGNYIIYFQNKEKLLKSFMSSLTAKSNHLGKVDQVQYVNKIKKGITHQQYYLLQQKNYLVFSTSKSLIEEVARGSVDKDKTTSLNIKPKINHHNSIWINTANLAPFIRSVLQVPYSHLWPQKASALAPLISLELKSSDQFTWLRGELAKENDPTIVAPYWTDVICQEASTVDSMVSSDYIPLTAATVQRYTFKDPLKLSTHLKTYLQYQAIQNSVLNPLPGSVEKEAGLQKSLNQILKNDITHCILGPAIKDAILLLHIEDPAGAINSLQSHNLIKEGVDQKLGNRSPIYKVNTEFFKDWLPHLLFPSFSPTIGTIIGHYLILANNYHTLSQAYKAYAEGCTWAREGTAPNLFLTSMSGTANYSFFVNMHYAWSLLMPLLKPEWTQWCQNHLKEFSKLGFLGLQARHLAQPEGQSPVYSINLLLNHIAGNYSSYPPSTVSTNTAPYFQIKSKIITPPFFVKTHKTDLPHMFIQDADYQLYFLDHNGKLLWKKLLEGPLCTNFFTIDYYNNNKYQYLCSTSEALHMIDYTGKEVASYPHKLPKSSKKVQLNLIDYEQNKKYRFLIADEKGNIYLKDTHYTSLPGWSPKVLGGTFATVPSHIHIQNDYFVALQESGKIYLFNRKGKLQPYFPIELGVSSHNPLVIKTGSELPSSYFVVLTDEGQLSFYNFMGVCRQKIDLPKTIETKYFMLAVNPDHPQDYAIFRQDVDKVVVFDAAGKLIFEKDYSGEKLLGQYYTFGDNQLYIITNLSKCTTHIYNQQGKLIHESALDNSGYPIQIIPSASDTSLTIYTSFENKILAYQFMLNKFASHKASNS